MKPAVVMLLVLAACEPRAERLLLLDLTLSEPFVLDATAAPWHAAGYTVEYRRSYPHLTRRDLARYNVVLLLAGREPEARSDALALGDLAILTEWTRRGGVVVLGYAGDGEGFLDRWTMNRWLAASGAGIVIGDYALQDTVPAPGGVVEPQALAIPLPASSLDNAGFAPFAAGRNHVLLVRHESQVLARTSSTAFIRPPRDAPAPRGGAAVVAASRVGNGLVLILSRHALGAEGAELRPSTLSLSAAPDDVRRTHAFLEALARWTRRPAEWAAVAPEAGRVPLTLAGGPRAIPPHPPPLEPPPGTDIVTLPQPDPRPTGPRAGVPAWVGRQGMRVLWSAPGQRTLESMLAFVDVSALNALATEVQAPARPDSLGLRNVWRATTERLQATSLRWFPAMALADLRAGGQGGTAELDRHGDTVPVRCGLDSLFWRDGLRPAYRALARLGGARRELVAGVALELDQADGGYAGTGFCDATYHEGLRALDEEGAETAGLAALPPAARYDTLLERGLLARYYASLERLVSERAAAVRAELRRANPELQFAFRAAQPPADWFSLGLLRGFSAPDAPVLLWTRERRVRNLLARYRERGIFALSAVALAPDRLTPNDWLRLRGVAFVEHDGFWLPLSSAQTALARSPDSLGRLIRRLAK
jgi:hypothetical protein